MRHVFVLVQAVPVDQRLPSRHLESCMVSVYYLDWTTELHGKALK